VSQAVATSREWSNSREKRIFDFLTASLALIVLSPLMLLIAALVRLTSKGPVLFRQTRMGKNGQTFQILKFRSMHSKPGPAVTKEGDSRLTTFGDFLRTGKLDELPQLINVVKGDMSLVGPRPKLPHHQIYTLGVLPGVTGAASLAFRDEEKLLRHIPAHALDGCQINFLMPLKRQLDDEYSAKATLLSDVAMLFRTAWRSKDSPNPKGMDGLHVSLVSLSQAVGRPVAPTQTEKQFIREITVTPPAHHTADA
jgi:lipopolysaccharide/colanic/teichoic acid biosynthesis glycosyltransferase